MPLISPEKPGLDLLKILIVEFIVLGIIITALVIL